VAGARVAGPQKTLLHTIQNGVALAKASTPNKENLEGSRATATAEAAGMIKTGIETEIKSLKFDYLIRAVITQSGSDLVMIATLGETPLGTHICSCVADLATRTQHRTAKTRPFKTQFWPSRIVEKARRRHQSSQSVAKKRCTRESTLGSK